MCRKRKYTNKEGFWREKDWRKYVNSLPWKYGENQEGFFGDNRDEEGERRA